MQANELQVSAVPSYAGASNAPAKARLQNEEKQLEPSDCRWWGSGKTDRPEH